MSNVVAFAQNKELPHNIEAEQAFLGTVLLDNHGADTLATPLAPDDFHEPVHGRIWQALQILRTQGRVANPTTLKQYFAADPANESLNLTEYLKQLLSAAIGTVVVSDYADLIRDLRQKRDLIRVCQMGLQRANDPRPDETAENIAEALQSDVMRAIGDTGRGVQSLAAVTTDVMEQAQRARNNKGAILGVPTGLTDLDRRTSGLMPQELTILAGRPGMGKSALAGFISLTAIRHKVPTAVFSLEMSSADWSRRILSCVSGVPYTDIRNGHLNDDQFMRINDLASRLADKPLHIDPTPSLTVSAIRARATRLKAIGQLGLVIVDYMGLVRPDDRYKGNKVAELGEISAGLKAMAKSLDVPVVALCQLNRGVEARDDKRPMLSDLRESGAIEQDADVVMFVYRDAYYLQNREPDTAGTSEHAEWARSMKDCENVTEIILAKNRHGTVGNIRVFGDMATARYADIARGQA